MLWKGGYYENGRWILPRDRTWSGLSVHGGHQLSERRWTGCVVLFFMVRLYYLFCRVLSRRFLFPFLRPRVADLRVYNQLFRVVGTNPWSAEPRQSVSLQSWLTDLSNGTNANPKPTHGRSRPSCLVMREYPR